MWSLTNWFRKRMARPTLRTEVDELGVRRELPDGSLEEVSWAELESVEIVTTDEGPFAEDLFWLFFGPNGGCMLPGSLGSQVLEHSSCLPGWDSLAVVAAMGSTENARFAVWRRSPAATQDVPAPSYSERQPTTPQP
jgi:hypothetical protein